MKKNEKIMSAIGAVLCLGTVIYTIRSCKKKIQDEQSQSIRANFEERRRCAEKLEREYVSGYVDAIANLTKCLKEDGKTDEEIKEILLRMGENEECISGYIQMVEEKKD